MRWHLVGAILLASATALAAPPSDAPATAGPSGTAAPEDPYAEPGPSSPAPPTTTQPAPTAQPQPAPTAQPAPAPAPSQQQAPAQAPAPDTTPTMQPPNAPPAPAKPASEQQPTPPTDKPAPAPVDQPAPRTNDTQSSIQGPGATPAPSISVPAPAIDVRSAPPACRSAGKLVSSPDRNAAAAAKISLALCVANAQLAPLELVDAEASIRDVDAATAASLAMLDEVAASDQPLWQVVALHAEGDLLVTISKRLLATVPPPGANAPTSAVELHDSRMAILQPRVKPWLDRAQQAFAEVDRIAKAHPELPRQQQAAAAIADSRARLASGVATR